MARKNNRSKSSEWSLDFGSNTVLVRPGSARVVLAEDNRRGSHWFFFTTLATVIETVEKISEDEFIIYWFYGTKAQGRTYNIKGTVKDMNIKWSENI